MISMNTWVKGGLVSSELILKCCKSKKYKRQTKVLANMKEKVGNIYDCFRCWSRMGLENVTGFEICMNRQNNRRNSLLRSSFAARICYWIFEPEEQQLSKRYWLNNKWKDSLFTENFIDEQTYYVHRELKSLWLFVI